MKRNSFSMPASPRDGGKVFRSNRFNNANSRSRAKKPRGGQYIDPKRFINKSTAVEAEAPYIPTHAGFTDFGFIAGLNRNIETKGYLAPSKVQDLAIEPVMAGRDVIGLANTGTGKTAAFLLPIIHRQKTAPRDPQTNQPTAGTVLIMAPTRELADQIHQEFRGFAAQLGLYAALCVGGMSMGRQIEQLRKRPQFVIGTPGRLKDLINQGVLKLDQTRTLVLDEADRMLDMGFIRDIRDIISKMPSSVDGRQTLCFSATMTPDIEGLMNEILVDPVTIQARIRETSSHIDQDVVYVNSKDHKFEVLNELLAKDEFEKVIVFGQAKYAVQRLADKLEKDGFKATAIHGNKSQPQRVRALTDFKAGRANILVATDVAARGLDIPLVSHVINFDQPATYEDYIHRIGRTGRAGHRGTALTFVER